MKVAIVSRNDIEGGAARAAYRVHRALLAAGVDSRMLVFRKSSDDNTVLLAPWRVRVRVLFALALERVILKFQKTANPIVHSLNWFPTGMAQYINSLGFDVINLHWVNAAFVSLREIQQLRPPVAWTQHDMWALLGAEHYESRTQPGRHLHDYKKDFRPEDEHGVDLNRMAYRIKKKVFSGRKPTLTAPSRWLAKMVSNSDLWKAARVEVIPNPCPSEIYNLIPQHEARKALGLPLDKKIILFGAAKADDDPRKGFQYLEGALAQLAKDALADSYLCVTFGGQERSYRIGGLNVRSWGSIRDERRLALLYNAATVLVVPSEQENLSNMLVEGSSCGVPCVAFAIGGNGDVIEDKQTGELVEPFRADKLAESIRRVLHTEYDRLRIQEQARKKYDLPILGPRYRDFFLSLLRPDTKK